MGFREKTKLKVKRKAAFQCCWCRNSMDIEIHHIIPREEGGPNTFENAAPLCPTCHSLIGANKAKRKQIKERRDCWYETVEKMYPDNTIPIKKLDDIQSEIKRLQIDKDKLVEDLKVEFPFIKIGAADSRPALFVRVSCPDSGSYLDSMALIDSGASQCCIPGSFAKIFEIELSTLRKNSVRTAGGVTDAYVHNCGLTIWNTHSLNEDKKVASYECSSIPFYFIPTLKEILLGSSFLNKYTLGIDYQRRVFWLNEP